MQYDFVSIREQLRILLVEELLQTRSPATANLCNLCYFAGLDVRDRVKLATIDYMERAAATAAVPPTVSAPEVPSVVAQSKPSIWDIFDNVASQSSTLSAAPENTMRNELEAYLASPCPSRTACPLRWWSENASQYPHVASVARRLLSVPATSVASERLFSKAGDVITKNEIS